MENWKYWKLSRIIVFAVSMLAASQTVWAVSFGSFDPRSLAMGGAGVASGNSANAAFYNPALLAMFPKRKELGKNSRFAIPVITGRYVESIETIDEVQRENPDQDLINAINAFNVDPSVANAESVLQASNTLESNLDDLLDGPVHADVNAGIVLGIGHKFEGGSIMINRRLVGDAAIEDFENDLQLLNTYVEAMRFIENGGNPITAASLYPSIFAADGTLLDQTDNLTSSAVGGAVMLTEVGMSMAKQFEIMGRDIAIGITPKAIHVKTYDFIADATSGTTNDEQDDQEDWDVNLDIGIVHQFDRYWRGGFVLKNIRKLKYQTSLGNTIELKPQARLGIMHQSHVGLYALDVDVTNNEPVRRGSDSRMLSAGGEWRVWTATLLRAGASKNLSGVDAGEKILYTFGVHWDIFSGMLDFTFAQNSYESAVGFQSAFRF